MNINNYDTHSQGLGIEFNGQLDCWLGEQWFKDNFQTVAEDSREKTALYFTDWGNEKKIELSDLLTIQGSTKNMKRFIEKESENYSYESREECIDFIINHFLDFKEYVKDDFYYSCTLEDFNLKIIKQKGFEVIESRGYSQGDFLYVISKVGLTSKENIDNLLWDLPIQASIKIIGEEIQLDEHLESYYNWDKDEIIEICLDYMKEAQPKTVLYDLKQELLGIIPDELQTR